MKTVLVEKNKCQKMLVKRELPTESNPCYLCVSINTIMRFPIINKQIQVSLWRFEKMTHDTLSYTQLKNLFKIQIPIAKKNNDIYYKGISNEFFDEETQRILKFYKFTSEIWL